MITSYADLFKGIFIGLILAIILLFLIKFGIIPLDLGFLCPTPATP